MFENFRKLFKKNNKREILSSSSKETAKERLHLVLMQDRANVSADFLDLMREEIIEVIKKYIDVDEKSMDVRLTNQENEDGTQGAPILYANIPIVNIKDESKQIKKEIQRKEAITKRDDNIKKDEIKQIEENKKIEEAKKIVEVEEENKAEKEQVKVEHENKIEKEPIGVEQENKIEEKDEAENIATEEKQIEKDTMQKEFAN